MLIGIENNMAGPNPNENELLFRTLFEECPLAVLLVDCQGVIREANPWMETLSGYPSEVLIGKKYWEYGLSGNISFTEKRLQLAIKKKMPRIQFKQKLQHRNGQQLWINVRLSFTYTVHGALSHIICMLEDVTERHNTQMAIKKSEALQHAILNALPDLKFRISTDGIFLDYFAAPGEEERLFFPPEKFLGKPVKEVLPEYLYKAIMKNLQMAIEQGKAQSFEYPLLVNGAMLFFEARINAINEKEAIAVIRDISALKLAQQELERKVRELDQNNQKLKKYVNSNLQLENFAHTVSHDLREPIRTINSFAQLLQSKYYDKLDDDANTFLDFITSSASSMNALIEDLLEFSRFNTEEHRTEELSLDELLEAIGKDLSGLIAEREASIFICSDMPTINGNWTKISQLFQNLISNAIKFVPKEKTPIVQVHCVEEQNQWKFSIMDNGIGIAPEYHQQIFMLFRRLHSRHSYLGSGIGLSLCKKVVEQHGGEIWVESVPGEGATFYFTLPKKYV